MNGMVYSQLRHYYVCQQFAILKDWSMQWCLVDNSVPYLVKPRTRQSNINAYKCNKYRFVNTCVRVHRAYFFIVSTRTACGLCFWPSVLCTGKKTLSLISFIYRIQKYSLWQTKHSHPCKRKLFSASSTPIIYILVASAR